MLILGIRTHQRQHVLFEGLPIGEAESQVQETVEGDLPAVCIANLLSFYVEELDRIVGHRLWHDIKQRFLGFH